MARETDGKNHFKKGKKKRMTKFKKLFLAGLALILTLSLGLQTTPALAMDRSPDVLPPGPPQMVLAVIKSMTALEIYPPQLKITGTLPSPCYRLNVSTQSVPTVQNTGTGTVFIWVRGVAPRGVLCTQVVKSFTTTLTLDPAKLGLARGKYVAMVNPVNGQSRFKMAFTVPTPKPETVLATITKLAVMESYPPQFKISGSLPSICYTLRVSTPQVTGRVISVFLRGTKLAELPCALMLKPFTTSMTIDLVKLKLAPGKYTVLFNPVNGVSRFKSEVFVGLD